MSKKPVDQDATSLTRRRILEAAAKIISEKGYSGATTRLIAAEAGVNEVTLFRHFGKKENLLTALIDEVVDVPTLSSSLMRQLSGDLQQDLLLMAQRFMQIIIARRDAIRLMLCESTQFPELREALARNPRQLRQTLALYLEEQMDQGKVRSLPADAVAQAFWGMLFAYGISLEFLDEPVSPDSSLEEVLATFVDVFVHGVQNR
jgi:AcrR family transcriptional regulator